MNIPSGIGFLPESTPHQSGDEPSSSPCVEENRARVAARSSTLPGGCIPPDLEEKYRRLREYLVSLGSGLVAFSGGVDSTFLVRVARDVLPGTIQAVYLDNPLNPDGEAEAVRRLADELEVPCQVISLDRLDPRLVLNDRDRCYWCKHELFSRLVKLAADQGFARVIEGSNLDDLADFRPGRRALRELNVSSPLLEVGLHKDEIRLLSRLMELPTWDKPAQACLASRIPYGTAITPELLKQVDGAEQVLHQQGFRCFRVRHHGEVARIELNREDFDRLLEHQRRETVIEGIRLAGYLYVTLDLSGYRTGSMNESLLTKEQSVKSE